MRKKNILEILEEKIKNRESARKSRSNKISKLNVLSTQVSELNNETELLKQENNNLKYENMQLKNEVSYLKNIINNYNPNNQSTDTTINNSSLLLFILIFSFGLFWNMDYSIINSIKNQKNEMFQFLAPEVEEPTLKKMFESMENLDMTKNQHRNDVELFCTNV